MTYQTPCSDPDSNPDDWFLSRDGKQYPDDALLDQAAADEAVASVDLTPGDDGYVEAVDSALGRAEAAALKAKLRDRRHAKDKCHSDCYRRLQCLGKALEEPTPAAHGTWGGYYEEELREIRREQSRRKRASLRIR